MIPISRIITTIILLISASITFSGDAFRDACSAIRCGKIIANTPKHVLRTVDSHGNSLLHYAVVYHRWHTAFFLLQRGLSANMPNTSGHTPFHVALRSRDNHMTRLLLEHGASATLADPSGDLPMHFAIQTGQMDILNTLADMHKSSVDAPGSNTDTALASNWETPLHRATQLDNIDAVRTLLSYEANPNVFDRYGRSLLYYALLWNRPRIANTLICHIDLDTPDACGDYPIHYALQMHQHEILSRILALSPNAIYQRTTRTVGQLGRGQRPTPIENTPLHEAQTKKDVNILCHHHAPQSARNAQSLTPLLYAIRQYYEPYRYTRLSRHDIAPIISQLLANGALAAAANDINEIANYIQQQESPKQQDGTHTLLTSAIQFNGNIPYYNGIILPHNTPLQRALIYHAHHMGYTPTMSITRYKNYHHAISPLKQYTCEQQEPPISRIIDEYQQHKQLENLQNSSYFCDIIIHLSQ